MINKILKPLAIASLVIVAPLNSTNAHAAAVGGNARPQAFKLLNICGTAGNLPCKIGEIGPAGGTIFFVDNLRQYPWDYLEAAPKDASVSDWCSNTTARLSSVTGSGVIGLGQSETAKMIQVCTEGAANSINLPIVDNIALPSTAVSSVNWYLPSVNELQMLQANIGAKLGWKKGAADYWTSTDSSDTQAWIVNGTNGVATPVDKTAFKAIRAIRAF